MGTRASRLVFRFGPRDWRSFKWNVILDAVLFLAINQGASCRSLRALSSLNWNTMCREHLPLTVFHARLVCSSVNNPAAYTFVDSHVRCLCLSEPCGTNRLDVLPFLGTRERGVFTAFPSCSAILLVYDSTAQAAPNPSRIFFAVP